MYLTKKKRIKTTLLMVQKCCDNSGLAITLFLVSPVDRSIQGPPFSAGFESHLYQTSASICCHVCMCARVVWTTARHLGGTWLWSGGLFGVCTLDTAIVATQCLSFTHTYCFGFRRRNFSERIYLVY